MQCLFIIGRRMLSAVKCIPYRLLVHANLQLVFIQILYSAVTGASDKHA